MNNNVTNPPTRRPQVDATVLMRKGITVLLVLVGVITGFYAIKMNNPFMTAGLLVLPFTLMLMHYPQITLILAVAMDASGMSIPGLTSVTAGLPAKLLLIAVSLLALALGQRQWVSEKLPERRPLIIFLGIILLLMVVRGSGLRFLGSSTWGGMVYINSISGILFLFFVSGMRVKLKHIRWIIYSSVACAALGSLINRQGWAESAQYSEVLTSRLRWVTHFSMAFLPFSLALISKRRQILSFVLVACAVGLLAITGDRKLFLVAIFVLSGFGYFRAAGKIQYIVKLAVIGLIGWSALFVGAKALPLGMQRAVSVVPGIAVDYTMGRSAQHSVDWRFEIWKYCLQKAPEYMLIGRGSAFDVFETGENVTTTDIQLYTPWFAFQTRSYHSGPLSLLIDYGIPGLLAMIWFSVLLIKRLCGYASRLASIGTFEARYALALCVILMTLIFRYFFIMGAIVEWAQFIGNLALIIIIVNSVFSDPKLAQAKESAAVIKDPKI